MAFREAAYTCWSTASGARVNNWGTRIDLVLLSTAGGAASLAAACTAADIMPEVGNVARSPLAYS